jgi:crossover junction endodeoxyribonuclease RuvC
MPGKGLVVLGLDPGSRCTGFGIVRELSGVVELLETGTIRPPAEAGLSDRLGFIFRALTELIRKHSPDEAALEDVFVSKNTSSALKLGQARGAALTACSVCGLPTSAYSPAFVKKTLVGGGRADKQQVAFMVGRILGRKPTWPMDSSDALAVAICHLNLRRWKSMVNEHDRLSQR